MYKKIIATLFAVLCVLSACTKQSDFDELSVMAERVEKALPEGYEKQTVTETMTFPFVNKDGQEFFYHICKTTFYAADPAEVTGLHIEALSAVFDIKNAECVKTFDASGHAAAIYYLDGCYYACCTSAPDASAVLEYASGVITEEDAIASIRSIFEGPDMEKERAEP